MTLIGKACLSRDRDERRVGVKRACNTSRTVSTPDLPPELESSEIAGYFTGWRHSDPLYQLHEARSSSQTL
jgi:hypothetical protein